MSCILEFRDDLHLWGLIHELQENIKDYKKVHTILLKYKDAKIGDEARKIVNKVLKDIPRLNKIAVLKFYEGIVRRLIDVWNSNEEIRCNQFRSKGLDYSPKYLVTACNQVFCTK